MMQNEAGKVVFKLRAKIENWNAGVKNRSH